MVLKNDKQLRDFLMKKCSTAVNNTKEKIGEELVENLFQFYGEYEPEEYIRTGALLSSLEIGNVKRAGNQHMSSATAEVGFDMPHYGLSALKSGGFSWPRYSDEEIQKIVMESGSPHGGVAGGTAIWKESMRTLGNKRGIMKTFRQELKKQGL